MKNNISQYLRDSNKFFRNFLIFNRFPRHFFQIVTLFQEISSNLTISPTIFLDLINF